MYSSNSELCRQRSKSCYSNSAYRPRSRHSSQRTFLCRCDVKSSDSCTRLESIASHAVGIHEENVVNIDLPPLMWFGYNKTPKILSATNTGRTILINGQWACGRPYITGGPLNGSYIFSQIHFHSPSEHEIDGRRYPLEMHMVHYKNSYLTQERAMKEKDGTIVIVYLFQLTDCGTTIVSQISKLASCLEKKNSRKELIKVPLDQFAKPFNSNYYTYRSSVPTDTNFYLLQWIISCNNLCVTRQEVEELLFIMNSSDSIGHIATTVQPENDVVFRVGEEDYCDWLLCSQMTESPCCHQKKVKSKTSVCKVPSSTSVCDKPSKKSVREKSSKKSVREKSSKKSVCEKSSKTSVTKKNSKIVSKKSSKKSITKKSSKTSVNQKSSKTGVNRKSSKKSVNKNSSKTSVGKKNSKATVREKNSKTSVCKESSKTPVCEESSKTLVCEEPPKKAVCKESCRTPVCEEPPKKVVCKESCKTRVCEESSKRPVCEKSSETSICDKSSETSVCENSSETSCTSVKEKKKVQKRDKCKSVKVDNATNTTPSCSKSDVKDKKQKEKKPKDVSKEQSKSKSVEKCSSKGGKSQTNVKQATSSTSKENAGGNKIQKKSAESKSCKAKAKKSGDLKEKCAESRASKTREKLNCPEANVKLGKKSSEKIKTIYEKKQKAQADPPPPEKKVEKAKIENTEPACSAECSNTAENIECARIGDNNENNDDLCCDDVQINYLFMPNTSSSVHSNVGNVTSDTTHLKIKESLTEKRNTTESKNFVKIPSHPIVNHALVRSVKFPVVKSPPSKHLYLHTKHIFRRERNNRGFTPYSFQECHLLIERDHNVLQEYNGKLYPNQLLPGRYEQVTLLARYPDPEDLKIHATECIAKLETLNELSIRAKFIISETNLIGRKSQTFSTRKKPKDPIQKKKFLDAECQCDQPASTSVAIDTKFLEEELNSCKSLIKWDLRNMGVESLDFKNSEIVNVQNLNLRIVDKVNSRRIAENNLKKALAEQNGPIRLLKNPCTSGPESDTISNDSLEQKNVGEFDKAIDDKSSVKSLKNSLDKRKKTTFFVYDRIEKDENSGKKIFVGSFRTRDEIEVLYKHRNKFPSDKINSDLSDVQSDSNRTLISGNEIQEDVSVKFIRAEDTQAVNKESTSKEENGVKKSDSKQVITLHKFEPKHYHLRTAREKSKSFIVGKISSKVSTESEKYSQLANMLGLDKTKHPKISFYEFQESDTRNANDVSLVNNSKFDIIDELNLKAVENSEGIDKDKVFPSTSERSDSLDGDYSEDLEGTSSVEKTAKSSNKNDSQAAVVIIPIEVDSLSKVEIVLIEHTDDVKKQKVENKYTSILKHYKRLILKLKSSFL